MPTSVGEPSSVTYSASATNTIRSPIVLRLPENSRRKSRWRNARITRHDGRVNVDELFDAWERAWSGRDPGGFEPLCADEFPYEDPLTPEPLQRRAARSPRTRGAVARVPDARVNRRASG